MVNETAPPPSVTAARVLSRDVTEWHEFTGRLEAVQQVDVRPRVSGLVAALVAFADGGWELGLAALVLVAHAELLLDRVERGENERKQQRGV